MDWVFPDEIDGWLTESEGRKLAELARGKRVLEIGSFCGRSTVCMAQTAESVTCIDPFDGQATSKPGDTFDTFYDNLQRYGLTGKITALKATTAEVVMEVKGPFDFVFIDGAHDFGSVATDIAAAEHLRTPEGLIAFHDYRKNPGDCDGRWDPDVTEAVDTYLVSGAQLIETVDTLAVVKPPPKLNNGAVRLLRRRDRTKPLVLLAMPSYDGKCSVASAKGFFQSPTRGLCDVERVEARSSFLTKTFNDCWCAALNRRSLGFTHFAMIHADICPEPGWLDTLLGELVRLDADMVSAVVPLKTEHGWTSTAIARGDDLDPWLRQRLTMKEVFDLPETFGADDLGGPLLLNTGLWVCRLDRPWCEEVCFDVCNRLVRRNGLWHAESIPEDWLFSAALTRLGAKIYATRKVKLLHDGCKEFPNDHVWGTQETDEVFQRIQKERMKTNGADQVHEGLRGAGSGIPGETPQPAGV